MTANLIFRLEQAQGGDRELDAEIWLAFTPGATRNKWSYTHTATGRICEVDETRDETRHLITVPAYTASVDAALSLAERVLPGKWPEILHEAWRAMIFEHHWHTTFPKPGQLEELPRQICIAILRVHGGSK